MCLGTKCVKQSIVEFKSFQLLLFKKILRLVLQVPVTNSPEMMGVNDVCRGIPKVELHCHLFGTIQKDTFIDLNDEAGKPFTDTDIAEFYTRGEKPVGVLRIFRGMDEHLIRRLSHLYRLTIEYLRSVASHNVVYCEFFWNPTGTVHVSGIPYLKAQSAITAAIEDAQKDYGIQSRLIVSIDREAPPLQAEEMVNWMIKYRSPLVVGIGIDYRENEGPPQLFKKAYLEAINAGFKVTAHAGEFGCPSSHIATAVNDLRVHRVDHGYTVLEDPDLIATCIEKDIIFTVVPTNSYYLRTLDPKEWAQRHPIRFMKKAGLKIFPNTDDPAFHQVTPTRAWAMMVECFDYDYDDLLEFALNGVDACFLDDMGTLAMWKAQIVDYFDRLGIEAKEYLK